MKLLVGGDPEIFLKDGDKYVSATDFDVPGTKTAPHKVKKGAVQIDGTALEINIDPASDANEFSDNLQTVISEARAFVPKGIEFVFTPVVDYEKAYFDKIPEKSKELGCDPDYRADTGERNAMPRPVGTMRTGSGHIALGWGSGYDPLDAAHFWDCRQMSLRLRSYFDAFKPLWDLDRRRERMYGHGAAFRPKPFGVEFRSLSNAWVGRPELYPWIFNSVKWVFDHAVAGRETKQAKKNILYNIHYQSILGWRDNKNYEYVYGPPPKDRLKRINDHIEEVFGADDYPEFPKDFVPAAHEIPKRYIDQRTGNWTHG